MRKDAAIILCGGRGSRINEFTKIIPKSLIKIQNKPIIWFVLSNLIKTKIKKIILPLGYKGKKIKNYVEKNFAEYLDRIELIETGTDTEIFERIYKVKKQLIGYDNFLLLNSDTVFNFDIKKLINFHYTKKNNISLSGIKMTTSWGSIVKKKNSFKVHKFVKNEKIENYKLKGLNAFDALRNTGISVINVNLLDKLTFQKKLDFETYLYNNVDKVGCYLFDEFWYPIETLKDYSNINKNLILKKKVHNLIKTLNAK